MSFLVSRGGGDSSELMAEDKRMDSPDDSQWAVISAGGNVTNMSRLNVMDNSCLYNYDTVACVRSCVLAVLAFLTAILCVVKVIRLHTTHHPSCHQFVIFYAAALECIAGGVDWIFWNLAQLDLLLQYLKLLQVLVMCHYYITLAIRALRKENLADRFVYPSLCLAVLYFTVITTLGIYFTESTHSECIAPYWLALSVVECMVIQVFAVSAFYITRRLNEISTLDSVRWTQKLNLWCIVIVFELSALATLTYDLTMQILGSRERGCSAIFSYQQMVYSPTLISLMVLKLLLPIWVMLMVFQPHMPEKDDAAPAYSEEGQTYGSIFSEDQAYRQLYHPSSEHFSCPSLMSSCASPAMFDGGLPPYVYANPGLIHSTLQPIAEEIGEDKPDKVKMDLVKSPPTEKIAPKVPETLGKHSKGVPIIRRSNRINEK